MRQVKKEVVYTMPCETLEQHKKAERLQARLYNKYNSVQVYPNGLYEVRVVATNAM